VSGYWLMKGGETVDRYISDPGVMEGRDDPPEVGDARVLCEVLGRPEAMSLIEGDDVIETLPVERAVEPFDECLRFWRSWGSEKFPLPPRRSIRGQKSGN